MLLLLAFLFPVALYLLILGLINRRRHALMVPGTWDFVGVLCGASGFLLAGGTFLLGALSDRWRMFWLFGDRRRLHEYGAEGRLWFLLFELLFVVALAFVAGWVLWMRRRITVIYNVEPPVFDHVLAQVLESKGFAWTRVGNRVYVTRLGDAREAELATEKAPAVAPQSAAPIKVEAGPRLPELGAMLDLDASPTMRNVTLTWTCYTEEAAWAVRQEVEAEVRRVLAELPMRTGPVASWMLSIGGMLAFVCFFLLVTLIAIAGDR